MTDHADIPQSLIDALSSARHVTVLTGSGVSAESGIPTFRDAQTGLWSRYRPEQLATPEAFEADPSLVWQWYQWRRDLIAKAEPNAGHRALVELEDLCPAFTLITQNVDGLHRLAGSRNLVEFHGNINRNRCSREGTVVELAPDAAGEPPGCPDCGGPVRPDVVWFGETIPESALESAFDGAELADVFIAAGTSAVVYPAAGLAEHAISAGATVAEINPDATPLSGRVHHAVAKSAGTALPAIVTALRRAGGGS